MISRNTIRPIAEAVVTSKLSSDVVDFVARSAEYHLKDLVQEAQKFARRSKRRRLCVSDINHALEMRCVEPLFGYKVDTTVVVCSDDTDLSALHVDKRVSTMEVATSSLPSCPIEPTCLTHWLSVDGRQPRIAQNPVPISENLEEDVKVKREKTSGTVAGEHSLSEESQRYLDRVRDEILNGTGSDSYIFNSLRTDPGLQEVLPYLCLFIKEKSQSAAKSARLDQLVLLMKLIKCVLSNPHFTNVEVYLSQIMPSAMTVLLCKKLSNEPNADEWSLRDMTASIVAFISRRFGQAFPNLQSDIVLMLGEALKKDLNKSLSLGTLYGAIAGVSNLGSAVVIAVLLPVLKNIKIGLSDMVTLAESKCDVYIYQNALRCLNSLICISGNFVVRQQERLTNGLTIQALGTVTSRTESSPIVQIAEGIATVRDALGDDIIAPFIEAAMIRTGRADLCIGAGAVQFTKQITVKKRKRSQHTFLPPKLC